MVISLSFSSTLVSVLNITDENNGFSITVEGNWSSRGGAEAINKLQKLLQLGSKNYIKVHVEEDRKGRNQTKIGDEEHKLSDLDTRKEEIVEELENAE